MSDDGFEFGRWWRVMDADGGDGLWCETSNEKEAREVAEKSGGVLQNLHRRVEEEWRDA